MLTNRSPLHWIMIEGNGSPISCQCTKRYQTLLICQKINYWLHRARNGINLPSTTPAMELIPSWSISLNGACTPCFPHQSSCFCWKAKASAGFPDTGHAASTRRLFTHKGWRDPSGVFNRSWDIGIRTGWSVNICNRRGYHGCCPHTGATSNNFDLSSWTSLRIRWTSLNGGNAYALMEFHTVVSASTPSAWGSGRQLQYRANWWFSPQLLLSLNTLLCWSAITLSLLGKCCAKAVLLCNNMCSQISWVTTRHLNDLGDTIFKICDAAVVLSNLNRTRLPCHRCVND